MNVYILHCHFRYAPGHIDSVYLDYDKAAQFAKEKNAYLISDDVRYEVQQIEVIE